MMERHDTLKLAQSIITNYRRGRSISVPEKELAMLAEKYLWLNNEYLAARKKKQRAAKTKASLIDKIMDKVEPRQAESPAFPYELPS